MNLKRNGIFAAVEVLVYGVGLFFIYRNVVQVLGVSMLGVWSLVLATTAFGRVADVGIAGGLARFVARSLGEGDPEKALLYMRTGLISISILMGGVALLFWYPLSRALAIALEGEELDLAQSILPWAILSFWLLNVKAVLDACLLGAHRADLCAISNIVGMVFQVVASLSLLQPFGLYGLAWAQAGQFLLAIGLSIMFLLTVARIDVGTASVRSWFSRAQFKEMLSFGVKLQIGTVANLLFEPAVKIVLGTVAGTALLGVFEMAYRMAYQVRNVAIRALQTTIPAFAELETRDPEAFIALFSKVCRTAAISAAVLMPTLAILSPFVSWLWLGEINHLFVYISALMSFMWAIAILSAPAYFMGIACGRVKPNVLGQVIAGILTPSFVYVLGTFGTPMVAIIGVVIGRIPGDLLPAIFTRPRASWRHSVLLNRACILSLGFNLAICVLVLLMFQNFRW